ncbi:MAG TPA: histidinol dehydrogenase [Candidatus Omnitrophica bacterium]|nr:histidinol dehydrogenase [Candidatus Omnitrophota bacterium]
MKIIRPNSKDLERLETRFNYLQKQRVKDKVDKILHDVRLSGDEALLRYTRKFDGVKMTLKQMQVTEAEKSGAYQDINPEFISTLKKIIANITKFYTKQQKRSWKQFNQDGVFLGEKIDPLGRVGVYVPAGTAPLVSCVYMSVLPAQIAGVKDIVLVTPPDKNGHINPHILVVADLLKVNEIYKVGGAQAIAALAFGTKTIRKVDKIVGPGNNYVTEAKRQVFGYCDIDMLAGPTELVVIANRHSNVDFVLSDLSAQAEHAGGLAVLITPSKTLAKQVKQALPGNENGYIVLVKNLDEALEVSNRIAPEHLEILTNDPRKFVKKVKNAGALFLGPYSPVAIGDYFAGPSHVLPTAGSARFFSGLSSHDFLRSTHILSYSKKALEESRPHIEKLCSIEGLNKHFESVKKRFE